MSNASSLGYIANSANWSNKPINNVKPFVTSTSFTTSMWQDSYAKGTRKIVILYSGFERPDHYSAQKLNTSKEELLLVREVDIINNDKLAIRARAVFSGFSAGSNNEIAQEFLNIATKPLGSLFIKHNFNRDSFEFSEYEDYILRSSVIYNDDISVSLIELFPKEDWLL